MTTPQQKKQQLEVWAVPQLQHLLPLDDDSLKQIVQYADSLSKEAAAEHLKNLLGDGAKALEFIASFNLRRQHAPSSSSSPATHHHPAAPANQPRGGSTARSTNHNAQQTQSPIPGSEVPRGARGGRGGGKKKPNIHALPARQVEGHGNVGGAYRKHDVNDYMATTSSRLPPRHQQQQQSRKDQVADNLALREQPWLGDAMHMPLITGGGDSTNNNASHTTTPRAPPSAAGPLVSDMLAPRKTTASSSRTASPAPSKTKVNISGGMAMHGASTALSDLDSAIRSLEVQTNPTLASSTASPADEKKRQCNCMATRHPLLDMAPNCLSCGKVICIKQGLGPCTFCHAPLMTNEEISKVLRVLKDERGEERMKANNASHRKADVAQGKARALTGRDFLASVSARSSPFNSTPVSSEDESPSPSSASASASKTTAKDAAQAHRDKLLAFQANNARRTQIHDEAADYDVPSSGTNMWASPAERAKQLKKQQKALREIEWNARPEYEKRKVVASIDLKGGRIVKKMTTVPMPDFTAADDDEPETDYLPPVPAAQAGGGGGGKFSANPLAAGLIRPMARERTGKEQAAKMEDTQQRSTWRRVQMDGDDNEAWILDGGVFGGTQGAEEGVMGEEPGDG